MGAEILRVGLFHRPIRAPPASEALVLTARMKLHEMRSLNIERPAVGVSFQKRNFLGWYGSTAARQGGRIGLRE
jgi:hypothetical protein